LISSVTTGSFEGFDRGKNLKKSWKMLDLYSISFVALTVNKGEKKDE